MCGNEKGSSKTFLSYQATVARKRCLDWGSRKWNRGCTLRSHNQISIAKLHWKNKWPSYSPSAKQIGQQEANESPMDWAQYAVGSLLWNNFQVKKDHLVALKNPRLVKFCSFVVIQLVINRFQAIWLVASCYKPFGYWHQAASRSANDLFLCHWLPASGWKSISQWSISLSFRL